MFRWVHFKLGINLFAQISILLHFFATVNPREYSLYYTGSMTHRVSITHRSDNLHFDQSLSDMGASELSWWLKKEKDEDKSEEQWKTIWVVVLKVTVLVLLFGLTASVAVFILKYNHGEDQTQSWTKGVEGYPAWEEVVDLILEAEQNLPEIVNVGVIGRCVHLYICV